MRLRDWTLAVAGWAALALIPNLIWETVQLPLYTLWATETTGHLVYAVLHCTVGDAMIAGVTYAMTSLLLRDSNWPTAAPWQGGFIITVLGSLYTAFSEYYNVYVAGTWAYSALMPLFVGLGLGPLLQWLLLPAVTLALYRRALKRWPAWRTNH